MQTRDMHKTKYFLDNMVLWKTLQDGISEEEGFFLLAQLYGIFAQLTGWRIKDLFTSEVSFILNC